MIQTAIEKRGRSPLKERVQYIGALGIIGTMLWVAGFPVFILFFIGALTFFIWKIFASEGRNETRRIFEFYLSANEILREDDRRWYGFEIQETIARGEAIVASMRGAPPLVYFTLGSLYQKIGDQSSALKYLSQSVGEDSTDETAIVYPARELRDYVQMLRKIERAPAEAPLTSSAIRSLERLRKNRGKTRLEESRLAASKVLVTQDETIQTLESVVDSDDNHVDMSYDSSNGSQRPAAVHFTRFEESVQRQEATAVSDLSHSKKPNRKSISEVLHDIYDNNVQ